MKLIRQVFEQELHCCADEDQEALLTMEIHDGGGGEYLVIHARHWALSDHAEIDALAAMLKEMLSESAISDLEHATRTTNARL